MEPSAGTQKIHWASLYIVLVRIYFCPVARPKERVTLCRYQEPTETNTISRFEALGSKQTSVLKLIYVKLIKQIITRTETF